MTRHTTKLPLFAALFLMGVSAPALAAPCDTENLLAGKKPHLSTDLKGDVALITDGTLGTEGTMWDAPVAVIMETPASTVTYDLGEPRGISAVVFQGDANDVYKISGSLDGTPNSYKLLVEAPNVVSRGHGLRTRALEVPSTTVRYLKIEGGSGDNFFSISEFAAYCKKPSPFPPALKTVAAPGAAAPAPPPAPAASNDGGRSFLFLFAAALVLAWLVYRTIRRNAAGAQQAAKPAGDATSPDATKPPEGPGSSGSDPTGGAGPGDAR